MSDLGELLRGIAAVLWPTVIIVAVLMFKDQARNLIDRVKRARFPGGEIELSA